MRRVKIKEPNLIRTRQGLLDSVSALRFEFCGSNGSASVSFEPARTKLRMVVSALTRALREISRTHSTFPLSFFPRCNVCPIRRERGWIFACRGLARRLGPIFDGNFWELRFDAIENLVYGNTREAKECVLWVRTLKATKS